MRRTTKPQTPTSRPAAAEAPPPKQSFQVPPRFLKPRPGPDALAAGALAEGDAIRATWGREVFSPIRYYTIEVGPFEASSHVRPGETGGEAMARLTAFLEAQAAVEYEDKLHAFLDRVRDSAEVVETRAAGGRRAATG